MRIPTSYLERPTPDSTVFLTCSQLHSQPIPQLSLGGSLKFRKSSKFKKSIELTSQVTDPILDLNAFPFG